MGLFAGDSAGISGTTGCKEQCSPSVWTTTLWILFSVGLIFVAVSAFVMSTGKDLPSPSGQAIVDGSQSYRRWMSLLPDGSHQTKSFKVYLFNITNPEELSSDNPGEGPPPKPILKEVGPFTYRQETVKGSLLWDTNETVTVNYRPTTIFRFVPEESVTTDQVWLNLPNLPLISAAHYPGQHPREDLFFNTSVQGFLWGQPVPRVQSSGKCVAGDIQSSGNCPDSGNDTDGQGDIVNLDYNNEEDCKSECVWGLFGAKNGTEGPNMTIFTGGNDWKDKGEIKRFMGLQELGGLFSGTECNVLNNSMDGFNAFPPIRGQFAKHHSHLTWPGSPKMANVHLSKNAFFKVFQSDFCRKLSMKSVGKGSSPVGGIDYLRFALDNSSKVLTSETLDNGFNLTIDGDGVCHCVESEDYGCSDDDSNLFQSTYFNLGPCQQNWTGLKAGMHGLALTQPHFLGADTDAYLAAGVFGLNPQPENHSTYFDLEPSLGVILTSRLRYQLNVVIQTRDWPDFNGDHDKVVVPFLWVEEAFDGISPELTAEIKGALTQTSAFRSGVIILLLGLSLMLISLGFYCCWKRNKDGKSGSIPMRPLTTI